MLVNLKVVSLNVWGIRHFSKDVSIRYAELIKALRDSDYDIVALQEVWSDDDYEEMRRCLKENYPDSCYFHSGLIGSGCCVFSKHPILETFQARYSLNGFAHKFYHGDWFGGKAVGLVRIKYFDLNISVYVTHLHANYSAQETSDEYLAHRISQAFELSQFISISSETADFVLLMGDLNLTPHELGFKILRDNAFLFDSFIEAKSCDTANSATCHAPTNSYLTATEKALFPNGKRIDYILYKHSNNFHTVCQKYEHCFGRIPGRNINYSDHEGISAEFSIEYIGGKNSLHKTLDEYTKHNDEIKHRLKNELIDAFNKIDSSMKCIYRDQTLFTILGLISFLTTFLFNDNFFTFTFIKTIFSSIFCIFCAWYVIFQKNIEKKHYQSVQNSMKFILKSRYNHNITHSYEKKEKH